MSLDAEMITGDDRIGKRHDRDQFRMHAATDHRHGLIQQPDDIDQFLREPPLPGDSSTGSPTVDSNVFLDDDVDGLSPHVRDFAGGSEDLRHQ